MVASRIEQQARRSALGRRAEDRVELHLRELGFEILGRNVRVGRDELDLVARLASLVVVCEVRARADDTWITPAQTITPSKAKSIRRGARALIASLGLQRHEIRLDVASVTERDGELHLNYLEGAL